MSKFICRTSPQIHQFADLPRHSWQEFDPVTLHRIIGAPLLVTLSDGDQIAVYNIELFDATGDAYRLQMINGLDHQWTVYGSHNAVMCMKEFLNAHGLKQRKFRVA